jgi:hypothetical protein
VQLLALNETEIELFLRFFQTLDEWDRQHNSPGNSASSLT